MFEVLTPKEKLKVREIVRKIPADEHLSGLSTEEIFKAFSAQEILKSFPTEEIEACLKQRHKKVKSKKKALK